MRVVDQIRPTEGHSSLRPNLEALTILLDLDKVIGGIVDIEGMLGPYLFDIGECEDVGVFYLLHVDADVMVSLMISKVKETCISIQVFLELERK